MFSQVFVCPQGRSASKGGGGLHPGQWRIYIVKFWTRAPPGGPNSFNFMQFLGKFGKIVCWRPPWGVGAPSSGKSWIRHCRGWGSESRGRGSASRGVEKNPPNRIIEIRSTCGRYASYWNAFLLACGSRQES